MARLAETLLVRIEAETERLEDEIDDAEEESFDDGRAPPDLALLRRAVIRMGRFARPQAEALSEAADLLDEAPEAIRFDEAASRARRTEEALEAARQRLNATADHLDMAQAARLGRNSYLLSIIAAIFLPLGFLTGLFGVNVAGMPGTENPAAFWWLTGVTVAIGLGVALVLRWLRLF